MTVIELIKTKNFQSLEKKHDKIGLVLELFRKKSPPFPSSLSSIPRVYLFLFFESDIWNFLLALMIMQEKVWLEINLNQNVS